MKNKDKDDFSFAIKSTLCFFYVFFGILNIPTYSLNYDYSYQFFLVYIYLIPSFVFIIYTLTKSEDRIVNSFVKHWNQLFLYLYLSTFHYSIVSMVFNLHEFGIVSVLFTSIILFLFIFFFFCGYFFIDKDKFCSDFIKKHIVRGNEIEARKFSLWSYYSFKSCPILKRPLSYIGYQGAKLIIFLSFFGGGSVFGLIELLERTILINSHISAHLIIIFVISIPLVSVCGFFLFAHILVLKKWNSLIQGVHADFGSYKLLINFKEIPYSKLNE
ncbi:hypothetical protein ACU5DF_04180 [Aliivibrio wodanis]|uniref:hypothetical protein n=1 Tax=Aliivibrio wodanis TaxID=80852 RepID=UPI00406D07CA